MTDAILDRIKEAAKPKARRVVKRWVAPAPEDFQPRVRIMAFDQTLTHTGWAILDTYGVRPAVQFTGMIAPPPSELKSLELTLWRAQQLGHALDEMLMIDSRIRHVDAFVHEMPAVIGHRLESSLMAAREVRRAVSVYGGEMPLAAVYNQAMKAVLLPAEDRKSKAAVREAVLRYADLSPLPKGSRLNEHVYDAVAIGLAHLYKLKAAS